MANFIEFAYLEMNKEFNMTELHSHDFYEFYFLLEGKREFFLKDKIFDIDHVSLIITPPFVLHKTEGGPYKRININVSEKYFTDYEKKTIEKIAEKTIVKLDDAHFPTIFHMLREGSKINDGNDPNKNEHLVNFLHGILSLLSLSNLKSACADASILQINDSSTNILKIVNYLNQNFSQRLNLQNIADKFFMSRTALCTSFTKIMHCSVMKYVTELRISAAQKLLDNTDKTIEEISDLCGFSSASYFGLAFKKECGKSPINYRKR